MALLFTPPVLTLSTFLFRAGSHHRVVVIKRPWDRLHVNKICDSSLENDTDTEEEDNSKVNVFIVI